MLLPDFPVGITEVPVAVRYDTDQGTVYTDQDDYAPATWCLLPEDEPDKPEAVDCE